MLKQILIGILIFATQAQAGTAGSGGGNSLICENGAPVLLYDYVEAEQLRGITFDNALLAKDEYTTALKVLARVNKIDPIRAEKYSAHVRAFKDEAAFLTDMNLPKIDDTGGVVIPVGCELRQTVVQKVPRFPEDKRYQVDKNAWDRMSIRDRAGLILHEVIYREALTLEHEDSTQVRYFNSMISSRKLLAGGKKMYSSVVDLSGLRQYIQFKSKGRNLVLVGRMVTDEFKLGADGFEWIRDFCGLQDMGAPYLDYDEPSRTKIIKEFTARFGMDFSFNVFGIWKAYDRQDWLPILRHYDATSWRQDTGHADFLVCQQP